MLSPESPKIIFQDDSLLVLDKPAGWVVNEADTTKNLHTIQSWLQGKFRYPLSDNLELRSGIVHRLDKDTSGVLLVAKTKQAFENLQKQFKERKVEKTYIALVHGKLVPKEGETNAPTGRLPWNRKKFGILPGGREAITRYKVIRYYGIENEKLSLLELYPKTGRTHQIRVHLKYLGHPIVSDKTYAGRKTWRHDTKWCPRIFLHAKTIRVIHPTKKKSATFESQLPQDLQGILEILE